MRAHFKSLSPDAVNALKAIPALFAYEQQGNPTVVHTGTIANITVRDKFIRIRPALDEATIPAEIFYEAAQSIDIDDDWELNRTHWAVKRCELPERFRSTSTRPSSDPSGSTPPLADSIESDQESRQRLPRLDVSFVRELGSGAFGTVWEATDGLLKRSIAVKFLTSTDESHSEEALVREAQNLARVSHPALVTVYGAAWLPHPKTRLVAPAIMMELLAGDTLDDWWSRNQARDTVIKSAVAITSGIRAMHAAQIPHGDLHPKNIIILRSGVAKLIDWRYQDSLLRNSSAHLRSELEHETHHTRRLIEDLLSRQQIDVSRLRGVRIDSLGELETILEDMLHRRPASAAAATVGYRASALVARFLYEEGPQAREDIIRKHEPLGLTRAGVCLGIDIGLSNGAIVEENAEDQRGNTWSILALSPHGRELVANDLSEEEVFLPRSRDSRASAETEADDIPF